MQSIYLPNNAETFKSISISIEACHPSVRKGTSGQFRLRSRYRSEYDDGTFQVILLNKSAIFISPVAHRWHHSRDLAGVNFTTIFSVWDRAFGTFMGASVRPARLGFDEESKNFIGEMLRPLEVLLARELLDLVPKMITAPPRPPAPPALSSAYRAR